MSQLMNTTKPGSKQSTSINMDMNREATTIDMMEHRMKTDTALMSNISNIQDKTRVTIG